jgi:hypothetical protein
MAQSIWRKPGQLWRKYIWDSRPNKWGAFERWLGGGVPSDMVARYDQNGNLVYQFYRDGYHGKTDPNTPQWDKSQKRWIDLRADRARERKRALNEEMKRQRDEYIRIGEEAGVPAHVALSEYYHNSANSTQKRNEDALKKARAKWSKIK